jgi:hypothetical protein
MPVARKAGKVTTFLLICFFAHVHNRFLVWTTTTTTAKQSTQSTANTGAAPTKKSRPEFQRPASAKTALISNGWIEQQRRSRMRTVWKDVLASLVEGRKPGEETTLWIQRQITNASGVAELEALHQIPVKWLQDVTFLDYSVDNRFSVRVYNLNEEFVFRCPKDPEAAQNWVMTLRSAKEDAMRKGGRAAPPPQNGVKPPPNHVESHHHQNEKKSGDTPRSQHAETPSSAATDNGSKMSIKEMRALAHGAGVNTHGMERSDLERIVTRIRAPRLEQPPAQKSPESDPRDIERKVAAQAEKDRRRRLPEAREASEAVEEAKRHRDQEDVASKEVERKRQEEEHQRVMAARVRAKQEALRKQHGEEERQRLARERQLREEEEMNRRIAEQKAVEQRRLQEEAVRRQQEEYRRQQETWQQQQTQEEQRRRMAEQQEAEQRRHQEEAYRRQWQQQQQQQQQQQPGAPPPQWQHHNQGPPPPQQQPGYGQQGRPQQHPQQNQGFYGQQQPQQGGKSPPQNTGNKYAEMAAQKDDNSSSQRIKHQILMFWALQPPHRQGLRRIEELITTIHQVFPPAFGVPGHEYFAKWKAVLPAEVDDDDKLEKRVKKLRFFLHPDKLPRDLTTDQSFVSRMLWDVTSDALEEHEKKREDLGWIHN